MNHQIIEEGNFMRGMKPVKVHSCASRVQADILIEALNGAGISAYRQSAGSGDYMDIYMGTSVFGEDIYVDKEKEEQAKEIIAGITLPVEEDKSASHEDAPVTASYKMKLVPVRIVSLIAVIMLLAGTVVPMLISIIFG